VLEGEHGRQSRVDHLPAAAREGAGGASRTPAPCGGVVSARQHRPQGPVPESAGGARAGLGAPHTTPSEPTTNRSVPGLDRVLVGSDDVGLADLPMEPAMSTRQNPRQGRSLDEPCWGSWPLLDIWWGSASEAATHSLPGGGHDRLSSQALAMVEPGASGNLAVDLHRCGVGLLLPRFVLRRSPRCRRRSRPCRICGSRRHRWLSGSGVSRARLARAAPTHGGVACRGPPLLWTRLPHRPRRRCGSPRSVLARRGFVIGCRCELPSRHGI
jgi:hypothetical protein